jgi:hypothetical protein
MWCNSGWFAVSSVIIGVPGASSRGGIEEDGLADAGELAQQFADGHPQSGAGGAQAHEVGDLEGEDAGEHVHADAVAGPVVHRGERDDVRVFHLWRKENPASDWDR